MSTITTSDLLTLATQALIGQGLAADDALAIATELVVAEISDIKTHGINKLVSLNLGDLKAAPSINEFGAVLAVDGRGCNGFLLMRDLVPRVEAICKKHGIAAAFAHNFSRYSSLYPYTDYLARSGLVAILINSAGPPAVAPYGSVDPLTGTNPIAFSFPLPDGDAQTFDFATSDLVWGAIRQAALDGTALPSGPFLNASGDVTTTPTDVNAVRSFGGPKGFALNLAIEVIAGLLTGAAAGDDVRSEFDCGAALIALDPTVTGASELFQDRVKGLFDAVRSARPENPDHAVRVPGDRGRSRVDLVTSSTREISISPTTIEMLQRMSTGESIAELSSNPLFN